MLNISYDPTEQTKLEPLLFQNLLFKWFKKNGRKHLPWQHPRIPYRVWISEIMLQQTQVTTVIPYFERFIKIFPTLPQLAKAPLDSVLSLWSGLGYYARARHLHHTAQKIVKEYHGIFPNTLTILESLPGIGRSTAGAILSLGFNQPGFILDGNVRRLFCRLHAIDGAPNNKIVLKKLWKLAETYASSQYPSDYTQAIMDFGSLVCTRQNPHCDRCPFVSYCVAAIKGKVNQYPNPQSRSPLTTRKTNCLVLIDSQGDILLEKRPPVGIWGGLWSLPECKSESQIKSWCTKHYNCEVQSIHTYPSIHHTFTHFRLNIQPIVCRVIKHHDRMEDHSQTGWFSSQEWSQKGLAAPIKKLLILLANRDIVTVK